MSSIESKTIFPRPFDPGWADPIEGSNMSPFTRNNGTLHWGSQGQGGRFGTSYEGRLFNKNNGDSTWGSSVPAQRTISPPAVRGFGAPGQPSFQTQVGGFGDHNHSNGGRSGSSSRRHSVSVVGGPGGRRPDLFSDGFGMTSPPNRGLGPSGFTDEELLPEKLGNALNLEIDESRKRGVEIEVGKDHNRGFPRFDPQAAHARGAQMSFEGPPGLEKAVSIERPLARSTSREVRPGSHQSRFSMDQQNNGHIGDSPSNARDVGAIGSGPGPIGGGPGFDPRGFQGQGFGSRSNPSFGGTTQVPTPTSNDAAQGQGGFGRPFNPFAAGDGRTPPFNQTKFQSPGVPQQGQNQGFGFLPSSSPPRHVQPPSPSYSTLSLSDLGRGVPLNSLPPNTPLYIATFKAGRRDVYYCADPTLLISNGDRVVVEADRGSDLGTVVYDQLTPMDIRDWQEKQATAALLSGAREHQPPGMAVSNPPSATTTKTKGSTGDLNNADLFTLLSGVGNGSTDNPMSGHARGPLAKEIMPKRIFAKSSQGPEEQARMMEKLRDEHDALIICREKAAQRGLPMQIVDAEYQWDRRKLTFYFKADKRIDFRDLTKENFRIFKSRIWMAMVPKDGTSIFSKDIQERY